MVKGIELMHVGQAAAVTQPPKAVGWQRYESNVEPRA